MSFFLAKLKIFSLNFFGFWLCENGERKKIGAKFLKIFGDFHIFTDFYRAKLMIRSMILSFSFTFFFPKERISCQSHAVGNYR